MKIGDLAILNKHCHTKSKVLLIDMCFNENKIVRILNIYNNVITFELTDPFNKAGEFECYENNLEEYIYPFIQYNPITDYWFNFYQQFTKNK